ncbi:MAG: hypothetical protein WBL40_03270 [Terrimicrobiaceae bacterium]
MPWQPSGGFPEQLKGHYEAPRRKEITTEHVIPPIPYRGDDWCAYYTNDQDDQPDCGWGATQEEAIENLIDCYDYEDTLPSFAELYGIDLLYARLHWQKAACNDVENATQGDAGALRVGFSLILGLDQSYRQEGSYFATHFTILFRVPMVCQGAQEQKLVRCMRYAGRELSSAPLIA